MYGLCKCVQTSVVGHFKSDYLHGCLHGRNVCITIHVYIYICMDFANVCKPAWWGTSSRFPDTAGYMTGTAK